LSRLFKEEERRKMFKHIIKVWFNGGFILSIASMVPLFLGIVGWRMYTKLIAYNVLSQTTTSVVFCCAIGEFVLVIVVHGMIIGTGVKNWLSDEQS